jgi:hypothetical protein
MKVLRDSRNANEEYHPSQAYPYPCVNHQGESVLLYELRPNASRARLYTAQTQHTTVRSRGARDFEANPQFNTCLVDGLVDQFDLDCAEMASIARFRYLASKHPDLIKMRSRFPPSVSTRSRR